MRPAWIILSSIAGSVIIVLLLLSPASEPQGNTSLFCAYDRIFIEFDDGKYKWGTIFLDDDGKPMACSRKYFTPDGVITRKNNDKLI